MHCVAKAIKAPVTRREERNSGMKLKTEELCKTDIPRAG